MQKVYSVYKTRGTTPLQVINSLKKTYPELQAQKMGYAGRLDPMAEGVLLILVGDECKKRKDYERLPKTYEFTALFGIETDTYDTLGIIKNFKKPTISADIFSKQLHEYIKKLLGKHMQEYPPFSSPLVQGKPLYKWAREGKISEIEIPKKEIEIYDISLNSIQEITRDTLIDMVTHFIRRVEGVFRQEEILTGWISFFKAHDTASFPCATFTISCSSGTYVRSITHVMGKEFGWGALALQIKRSKVGKYTEKDALRL